MPRVARLSHIHLAPEVDRLPPDCVWSELEHLADDDLDRVETETVNGSLLNPTLTSAAWFQE
jgi:hypothetical protein